MKIEIVVATHKRFNKPELDGCYSIFKNGSFYEFFDEYRRDDIGENVSKLQPVLCELSSLYCAWKNDKYDVIGLCHYRRYFLFRGHIITSCEIQNLIKKYGIILPKKNRYFFYTPFSYYINRHAKKTKFLRSHYVEKVGETIKEFFPSYYKSYTTMSKRHSAHMKNMFIMEKKYADSYLDFLFGVLLKMNETETFKERALGTMGEFLMDIWLDRNEYHFKELRLLETEKVPFIERMWKKLWKR